MRVGKTAGRLDKLKKCLPANLSRYKKNQYDKTGRFGNRKEKMAG